MDSWPIREVRSWILRWVFVSASHCRSRDDQVRLDGHDGSALSTRLARASHLLHSRECSFTSQRGYTHQWRTQHNAGLVWRAVALGWNRSHRPKGGAQWGARAAEHGGAPSSSRRAEDVADVEHVHQPGRGHGASECTGSWSKGAVSHSSRARDGSERYRRAASSRLLTSLQRG